MLSQNTKTAQINGIEEEAGTGIVEAIIRNHQTSIDTGVEKGA
jgi:hypothetical protein